MLFPISESEELMLAKRKPPEWIVPWIAFASALTGLVAAIINLLG